MLANYFFDKLDLINIIIMFPTELIDLIVTLSPPELVLAFTIVSKRYSKLLVVEVSPLAPTFGTCYFQFPLFNESLFEGDWRPAFYYKNYAMYASIYSSCDYDLKYIFDLQSLYKIDLREYFIKCFDDGLLSHFDLSEEGVKKLYNVEYLYIIAFSKERVNWLTSQEVFIDTELDNMLVEFDNVNFWQYVYDVHLKDDIDLLSYCGDYGVEILNLNKDIFIWLTNYLPKEQLESMIFYSDEVSLENVLYLRKESIIDSKSFIYSAAHFSTKKEYEIIYQELNEEEKQIKSLVYSAPVKFLNYICQRENIEPRFSSNELENFALDENLYYRIPENIHWIMDHIDMPLKDLLDRLNYDLLPVKIIQKIMSYEKGFSLQELRLLERKAANCKNLSQALMEKKGDY